MAKTIISKKGLEKGIHPYSRKVKQLNRQAERMKGTVGSKVAHYKEKMSPKVERWTWLQLYLVSENAAVLDKEKVNDIVKMYLDRWDEEIAEFEKLRRPGRSLSSKEQRLRLLRTNEKEEASQQGGGLAIPDMTDVDNVALLKAWNGDYHAMHNIKSVRWILPSAK